MADPKVPEPQLTSQEQIYGRSSKTDEKTPEIEPGYRARGATSQQKEEESKPWVSEGHTDANVDDQNRDEQNALETVKDKASATSNSACDTINSATIYSLSPSPFCKYTY